MKNFLTVVSVIILFSFSVAACARNEATARDYIWNEITPKAEFPKGYGYPVFVMNDGNLLALNNGGWLSKNGKAWTKTALPESGLNSAYQKYVQFKGAIYALGAMRGNYLGFTISKKILRTTDGKTWETVAEKSNLPTRVFYGATVFKDKIWLVGGFDGKIYHNDVWTSKDGANWTRVAAETNWSPRNTSVIVFKNKMLLLGGGVIDGEREINPNAGNEFWVSSDGVNWTLTEANPTKKRGGTPIVFDDKLWFVGANRNNGFDSGVLFSEDGANFREMNAPWSPRGAAVVWIWNDKLYMTGGKYSYAKNGEIIFVYSNDVWAMSKQ